MWTKSKETRQNKTFSGIIYDRHLQYLRNSAKVYFENIKLKNLGS